MDDTIAVMLSSPLKKKKKLWQKERKEEFLLCLTVLSFLFHYHPVDGRLSATAESLHEGIQTTCLLINLQNTQFSMLLIIELMEKSLLPIDSFFLYVYYFTVGHASPKTGYSVLIMHKKQ